MLIVSGGYGNEHVRRRAQVAGRKIHGVGGDQGWGGFDAMLVVSG